MTPKNFQIQVIRRMLQSKGIDTSSIDLNEFVDSELTLEENARLIKEHLESIYGNFGYKERTKSIKKLERFMEAIKIFDRRKMHQKNVDSYKQAKTTFNKSELSSSNFQKWKSDPNRYDIEGIDSKYMESLS